jgi:NodT family efflux transporter outer membrane factor (OMF) lipoprotein
VTIKKLTTLALITITLLVSGCAVGPNYVRPSVSVPAKFKEAKGKSVILPISKDWKIAHPCDDSDRGNWWSIFHDPKLNQLEARLNASNQTIVNAYQNYLQACELVNEARANFFPILSVTASATRQKQNASSGTSSPGSSSLTSSSSSSSSSTSSSSSSSSSTGAASTGSASTTGGGGGIPKGLGLPKSTLSTIHSLIFNASWEPDIWGLVRRTVEGASAGAQASAALLASTRLSSQASLAQIYFELRGLDTDQKLLNDTVASYKETLQLTKNRYVAGVAALADIVQARTQVESAEAQAINNGIARAQYEHAIAVLIGVPPADFSIPPYPLRTPPPPIPVQVPSTLLERRPDVAQAERLMAQANAQIGVAIAAYFPTLTLSGSASDVGTGLAHWFSLPAFSWAYGPQLAETILDGGLRAATISAARHGYKASVANYRQVVLTAFQDVEDNLASLRILTDEAVVQNQAAASAELALKLVINQYKAGTVTFDNVIIAQITAYTAQKTAADITYQRMTSAVGLIKALGGGWDASSIAGAG